jgi:hypothetical protein
MIIHELKTVQPYFDNVWSGMKKFEVRKNDRGFKLGDLLLLQEYDRVRSQTGYTGKEILVRVDYILDNENYCKDGYVVMGFSELHRKF